MLMERRTVEDLEAVLAERLAIIRERRATGEDVTSGRTAQRRSA
jgi:hypothetical protein